MKNKKQRNSLLLVILLLAVTIGYAVLTTNLKITGTANIKSNTWDVHFENVRNQTGVTPTVAPVSNNTTTTELTFTVDLDLPGDFYQFNVDAVNDGSIDAMVDLVTTEFYTVTEENEEVVETKLQTKPDYINYTVTYDDDTEILSNHLLAKNGGSETYKVRIEYDEDEVAPSDVTLKCKITIPYIQANSDVIDRYAKSYSPGDLVYFDPVSSSPCNENTFSLSDIKTGNSTCYKWRVLTIGDTDSDRRITIQLDHNITRRSHWTSAEDNTLGPDIALSELSTATSQWTRVPLLNYEYDTTLNGTNQGYNYGVLTCTNGTCKTTKNNVETTLATNVRARLITGDEITALTMNAGASSTSRAANWTRITPWGSNSSDYYFSFHYYELGTTTNTTQGASVELAWLIENTVNMVESGATVDVYTNNPEEISEPEGYHTLTPCSDESITAWTVYSRGYFNVATIKYSFNAFAGTRPVIEIEKTKLS